MNPADTWKSYRQIATQTAPPGQLVLMLFDGAILALERALTGFEFTDPAERNETIHNNIRQATDIIRHLNHSLNLEAGGQLAETLRKLYVYFEQRLTESNLKKQRPGIDEVIARMKDLRDAWAAMLKTQSPVPPYAPDSQPESANGLA